MEVVVDFRLLSLHCTLIYAHLLVFLLCTGLLRISVPSHFHGGNHSGARLSYGICSRAPNLTLITPWSRNTSEYLHITESSIEWQCISRWIIVYDLHSRRVAAPQFSNNSKVLEIFLNAPASRFGNLQRQEALRHAPGGMVYFLDDDNAMHPRFWKWFAANATLGHVYTFDALRSKEPIFIKGDRPVLNCIDSAQILFDAGLVGNLTWIPHAYDADGLFIQALVAQNKAKHVYVPEVLAYHNYAQHYLAGHPWTRLESPNASVSNSTWPC